MTTMIDEKGAQVDVKLETSIYKEAMSKNLTVPQLINQKYPTSVDASANSFEQLCTGAGLIVGEDHQFGLKSPTLASVLDGTADLNAAAAVAEADPASRILYPAVFLELIENKLQVDRATDPNNFDKMVAMEMSVASNRIEQPVINLTKSEQQRAQAISQLAEPQAMLTITTADTSRAISTFSIGLEVSDQALAATTLDFVSMAIARQSEVERNVRTYDYLLGMLNGDADVGQGALNQTKADTYDGAIDAIGTLSKKAIVGWLLNNSYQRAISHIVTDLAGMEAIEKALENVNTNNYIPGALVPQFSIMNKLLQKLEIFIVDPSAGWPVNTLMGLDRRYAITRIKNSAAAYSAVEKFVLRRSNVLRFDFAELAYRNYDNAFDTLSLTLTT